MAADPAPQQDLFIREQLAHIDQLSADADHRRRTMSLAIWPIGFGAMTAGAALFAAGAAFMKVLGS